MGTASLLARTLRRRDPEGAGHAARVTTIALRLAEALGAGTKRVEAIRAAGPLHDIGKLAVHPAILNKPGSLDPHELREVRIHPRAGVEMLEGDAELRGARDCVLYHHERWDGTGYPLGLRGEAIPFEARILAVADAYDAMTSDRPYRAALTREEAIAEVERCAGTQFDPLVAEAFLAL
jgi:HD-GYP domain-containing protein (c-di-GMP phosphodiesterase class II)